MDKNDVSVVLKPIVEKNKWTGDVSIGLVSTNQMTLSREDQIDFLKLARRFCALFPLMLDDYMKKKFKELEEKSKEQKVKYLSGVKKQAQEQSDHKQTMDMVNHPPHYNKAGIETIDAIQAMTGDGFEFYLQGNIMKYLWRYRYKNGVEDLKKAEWYLSKLIEAVDVSES